MTHPRFPRSSEESISALQLYTSIQQSWEEGRNSVEVSWRVLIKATRAEHGGISVFMTFGRAQSLHMPSKPENKKIRMLEIYGSFN